MTIYENQTQVSIIRCNHVLGLVECKTCTCLSTLLTLTGNHERNFSSAIQQPHTFVDGTCQHHLLVHFKHLCVCQTVLNVTMLLTHENASFTHESLIHQPPVQLHQSLLTASDEDEWCVRLPMVPHLAPGRARLPR